MAKFIHSIQASNQAIAADSDVVYDLPVNPLTCILLHVSPLNDTGTITDYSLMSALLTAIANVRIDHKGAAVINATGTDLAVLAMMWHRATIWQSNAVETTNSRRSLVIPIFFGRKAYDPLECFPSTRKGEFHMTVTYDIAGTGFDGLRISIETIELPEALPTTAQRVNTLSQTFAATGRNEIDLPIGQVMRGLLLFGTTSFAGAAPAPTLGELQLFVNNQQQYYSATDFEVLRATAGLKGLPFPPDGRHIHSVNAGAAGQTDSQEPEIGLSLDANYVFMDLDPTFDDTYSLDTSGAGRVHLVADAETADAVRILPVERVPVSLFTQ